MNRTAGTRVVRLERIAGIGRVYSDLSKLSDAELSRLIQDATGIRPEEQTDEVLERLASEVESDMQQGLGSI